MSALIALEQLKEKENKYVYIYIYIKLYTYEYRLDMDRCFYTTVASLLAIRLKIIIRLAFIIRLLVITTGLSVISEVTNFTGTSTDFNRFHRPNRRRYSEASIIFHKMIKPCIRKSREIKKKRNK